MSAAAAPATSEELSLKEWARQIAAQAPPLDDDTFAQLHQAFIGSAPRYQAPALDQAA